MLYLLYYSYILTLMDLFLLPYSTHTTISSEIVNNVCSFLLSNDSCQNKISHALLRNADKPMIQSGSTAPGKIHYGLPQSYVNSYCHQNRDTQHLLPVPEPCVAGKSFYHSSNGLYPAVINSDIYQHK